MCMWLPHTHSNSHDTSRSGSWIFMLQIPCVKQFLILKSFPLTFNARCYASAVYAMVVCPSVSVHLSKVGVLLKLQKELSWYSGTVIRKNSGTSKNKGTSVWPPEFSPQTVHLDVSCGKLIVIIVLSTELVNGRACKSHLWRSMHRCWKHIVYYTSVDCTPITPLFRLVHD